MKKNKLRITVNEIEKTNKLLRAILLFLVKYHTPISREKVIVEIEKVKKGKL